MYTIDEMLLCTIFGRTFDRASTQPVIIIGRGRCRYENCALIISNERSGVYSFALSAATPNAGQRSLSVASIAMPLQRWAACFALLLAWPASLFARLATLLQSLPLSVHGWFCFPYARHPRFSGTTIQIKPRVPSDDPTEWWMRE